MRMYLKEWPRYLLAIFAMIVVYYGVINDEMGPRSHLIQKMTQPQSLTQTNEQSVEQVVIYAKHENGLLVPVPVTKEASEDEVMGLFDLLTTKQNQLPIGVNSVLDPSVSLHDYTLVDGVLTLNLSTSFLNQADGDERLVLEALVWTFTSLFGIERLKFEVEGEPLQDFNGTLVVGDGLTQQMGINLQIDQLSQQVMQPVTLYYYVQMNDAQTLVPVTHLIDSSQDPVTFAIEQLRRGDREGAYYTLLDATAMLLSEPVVKEGILTLDFDPALYYSFDQKVVSSDLIRQLQYTFLGLEDIQGVSLSVNGNYQVLDETDTPVSRVLMPAMSK